MFGSLEPYYAISFANAPPLAPYYTLELEGWDEWDLAIYVPSEGLVGTSAGWTDPTPRTARGLREAIEGLEPKTAEIAAVTVAGEPRDDAAAFVALFDKFPPAQAVLGVEPVVVKVTGPPAAWIDQTRQIEYYPDQNVLRRKYQWVQASDDVAALLEGGGSSRPSPIWLAPLGLAAAFVGVSVWLVRRGLRLRARDPFAVE